MFKNFFKLILFKRFSSEERLLRKRTKVTRVAVKEALKYLNKNRNHMYYLCLSLDKELDNRKAWRAYVKQAEYLFSTYPGEFFTWFFVEDYEDFVKRNKHKDWKTGFVYNLRPKSKNIGIMGICDRKLIEDVFSLKG